MRDLTLLAGTGRWGRAVLDVLTDLATTGLIREFMWLDLDEMHQQEILVLTVSESGVSSRPLARELALSRCDLIRMCVVDPHLVGAQPVGLQDFQRLAALVSESLPAARKSQVRALVVRPAEPGTAPSMVAYNGWHNVILSPENAQSPFHGTETLRQPTSAAQVGRHEAFAIASLMGMWGRDDVGPLDDESTGAGEVFRLFRAFHRQILGDGLEEHIKREVLEPGDRVPRPSNVGSESSYIDDGPGACFTMAQAVLRKNANLLTSSREHYTEDRKTRLGAWEAIRMFLSFLGAAIKNAPRAWAVDKMRRVSGAVAAQITDMTFGGDNTAYQVVVHGIDSEGKVVAVEDQLAALRSFNSSLDNAGFSSGVQLSTERFEGLWQSYIDGALTLVDAGERDGDLRPIKVGGRTGVVRSTSLVVPPQSDVFDNIPGSVAARGLSRVEPYNVAEAMMLDGMLRGAENERFMGADASETRSRLRTWGDRIGRTYSWHVGSGIMQTINRLRTEIAGYADLLARIGNPDDDGTQVAIQKKAARLQQFLGGALLVTLVVLFALWFFDVMHWKWMLFSMGIAALVWLVASVIAYMRSQQALFRAIHERMRDVKRSEIASRNIKAASHDLERAIGAYGQFLSWSRALSSFLEKPLGDIEFRDVETEMPQHGLPLSVAFGVPEPDEHVVAKVSGVMRQSLYRYGWLTDLWDTLLDGAGSLLSGKYSEISSDPKALYGMSGDGTGSELAEWSHRLAAGASAQNASEGAWERIISRVVHQDRHLRDQLLGQVRTSLGDQSRTVPKDEFVVLAPDGNGGQPFTTALLTELGISEGIAAVTSSNASRRESTFSTRVTVYQFSEPFFGANLKQGVAAASGRQTVGDDTAGPSF